MHSELVVKNGQAIKEVSKNHTSNFSYRDFNEEATTEKYCDLQYSIANNFGDDFRVSPIRDEGFAVVAITGMGKTKSTLGTLVGMLGKDSILFVTSTNAIIDNCKTFKWGTDFKSPFLDDMRRNNFKQSIFESEDKINTYLSNLKDFELFCKSPDSNFVANYSDATFLTYHKLYYDIVHNYKGREQDLVDLLSKKKVFIFDEASMTKSKEIGQTIVNFIKRHKELMCIPRIGLSFSNIKSVNKMSYTDKDGKLCTTDVAEVWAGDGTLFKHIIFKLDAETALKEGILPVYKYLPVLVNSNSSLKRLKKATNISSRELSQSIKKFIQNINRDSFVETLKNVFSTEFNNMLTKIKNKENVKYTIQIPYQSKEALKNSKDYVDGCIKEALKETFTGNISMESFTVISRDSTTNTLGIHDVDDVDSSNTNLVVVHTVNMLAEGVHLNKRRVNCLILLRDYCSFYTPRQVLGRVLHTYYDSQPIVVDICGSSEKDIGDSKYQDLAKLTDFIEIEDTGAASNNSSNIQNLNLNIKDTVKLLKSKGFTSASLKKELYKDLRRQIQCKGNKSLNYYKDIENWCRKVLTDIEFITKNSYIPVVYASSFYNDLLAGRVLEV